jgi:hypothetical protein
VLGTVTVRSDGSCDASTGTGSILISHDRSAADVLRQITVIVDGRQYSPTLLAGQATTTVDGLNCDDAVHTVLVVAVGKDGSAPSRAFAVLMPR